MNAPKPVYKKDRRKWKKKSIELAKYIVRNKIGYCECCGSKNRQLQGAHIIPVDFEATAADPENILCLCSRCHIHDKYSAHQHPTWFTEWLDGYAPGRKEKLWEKARPTTNYSAVEWKEIYDKLDALQKCGI
jgi:HNH endonuclease